MKITTISTVGSTLESDRMRPLLIVVTGPTGSGKTDLAVTLAGHFGIPIISADSRQVYRGMRIGTAQPSDEQLAAVKHYFIADREPTERFTCADFEREASTLLEKLFSETDKVIAVGGSGLYIDALCNGLDALPDIDIVIRKNLIDKLSRQGLESLLDELHTKDPDYYETVDRQNPARVLRALEVCRQTGRPFSSLRTGSSLHSVKRTVRPFDIIKIGIDIPRAELYGRIDRRVENMMAEGLEAEARRLYPLKDLPALNTVGYSELFDHFDGKYDVDEVKNSRTRAVELIRRNSRRYAKRQLTWFRRDPEIKWFRPDETTAIIDYIDKNAGETM